MENRQPPSTSPEVHRNQEILQEFEQFLGSITKIIQHDEPSQWWIKIYRILKRAQRNVEQFAPEMREMIMNNLQDVYTILQGETRKEPPANISPAELEVYRAKEAKKAMQSIAELLASDQLAEEERQATHRISIEQLAQHQYIRLTIEQRDGESMQLLEVYAAEQDQWFAIPLPQAEQTYIKGGCARVILKLLSGAPQSTIEAELPYNDVDVITADDTITAAKEGKRLGVDAASLEFVDHFDAPLLCASRDLTLNGVFLGKNGLVYSDAAQQAAATGTIDVAGHTFGVHDRVATEYDGEKLATPIGMARLMKTVAEGKAVSFPFTPLNEQVDLGNRWIYLAWKFSSKRNRGELLAKMYALGKQMGQVREGENDIYAVLDRVHTEHAYYSLKKSGGNFNEVGVARWLQGKFADKLVKQFQKRHRLGNEMELQRKANDTLPRLISLEQFNPSSEELQDIDSKWDEFVARCAQRTEEYKRNKT